MLRLTPFTYLRPTSVENALEHLTAGNGDCALMGGGTDLLPNIKHRLANPKFVVGLSSIPEMKGIELDDEGRLQIGGAVTLWQLQQSPLVAEHCPALVEAASLISTPQVQRTGTLAGNMCLDVRCNYYNQSEHWRKAVGYCMKKDSEICRVAPGGDRCWAVSSADTVPVLIAHDAEIRIANQDGTRWQTLSSFYQDDGLVPITLAAGDIVTHILIPPSRGLRTIYSKLRIRMSFDFPLVGAAVGIELSPSGSVSRARIVLTAVSAHPLRVTEAETILMGEKLTETTIKAAAEKVFRAARPMDNTEGSISHRKRMARVFVERSLRQLAA